MGLSINYCSSNIRNEYGDCDTSPNRRTAIVLVSASSSDIQIMLMSLNITYFGERNSDICLLVQPGGFSEGVDSGSSGFLAKSEH